MKLAIAAFVCLQLSLLFGAILAICDEEDDVIRSQEDREQAEYLYEWHRRKTEKRHRS